jgi:hypothetical protein
VAERQPIDIYLNDHLAGATGACELMERLAGQHSGTPLGETLEQVLGQLQQDRSTLMDIMAKLGVEPDPIKQATAMIAEMASRFKLGGGSGDVGRLLALETLSLGIEGKACLWSALGQVADQYGALSSFDFDELLGRAERQRATLERARLAAAAELLALRATVGS